MAISIGQVFHLTPFVDDIDRAVERLEQVFAPHIWYRGYEPNVNNRDAALMAIADFVIEPMHPRGPKTPDEPETSMYRFRKRFGPCIHSLAVYVDDLPDIRRRLDEAGIRITDGGMPSTVFPHPKDFPGLIEFCDSRLWPSPDLNPRLYPSWSSQYWRDVHPLGLEFASHVTLLVNDHRAAAEKYVSILGVEHLPEQPGREASSTSSYVTFGPDTMIELAEPSDAASAASELRSRIGETWWGVTFKVRSADAVEQFLSSPGMGVPHSRDGHTVRIDRDWMFGAEYAFTDVALDGDSRA